MKEKITFIIPTIGRDTLLRTINSLLKQSLPNWKAIVVCDGINAISFGDERISCLKVEKTGKSNHAGAVRNFAIDQVDTEWMAFVDDDDTLSKNYMLRFEEEVFLNPKANCIIWRMYDRNRVLPEPKSKNFIKNYVGISFAVKKSAGIKFEPSGWEDYYYLDKLRSRNERIVISPYVNYFVRSEPDKEIEKMKFERVLL